MKIGIDLGATNSATSSTLAILSRDSYGAVFKAKTSTFRTLDHNLPQRVSA
jgi:hypothetical protein